jgi:hypothetical protein
MLCAPEFFSASYARWRLSSSWAHDDVRASAFERSQIILRAVAAALRVHLLDVVKDALEDVAVGFLLLDLLPRLTPVQQIDVVVGESGGAQRLCGAFGGRAIIRDGDHCFLGIVRAIHDIGILHYV